MTALQIFLCHSNDDKSAIRQLYRRLQENGFAPWLDEEDLLPGQNWREEIPKVVRAAGVVLVCLSRNALDRAGYVQKEIKQALDVADEQPEGSIFVIPVRLEECSIPERLRDLHWVNLFEERGYERLIRSLRHRAEQLSPVSDPTPLQVYPDQNAMPGLNLIDNLILRLSCELAVKQGAFLIQTKEILEQVERFNVSHDEFMETIEILEGKDYVEKTRVISGDVPVFLITNYGFSKYAQRHIENYNSLVSAVGQEIINGKKDSPSIATFLDQPQVIIEHILDVFQERQFINVVKSFGGLTRITNISAELKRMFRKVGRSDSAELETAFFTEGKQLEIGNLCRENEAPLRPFWARVNNQSSGSIPHGSDVHAWDTHALRELLTAAFSDEELVALCFDHFRPVYQDFAGGMSKGAKIQRLLDYCMREHHIEQLVEIVKERRPVQYQQYVDRLER
ncbi:MAG: TIR domain-containing protein [Chloroflexaceae bacterium]